MSVLYGIQNLYTVMRRAVHILILITVNVVKETADVTTLKIMR